MFFLFENPTSKRRVVGSGLVGCELNAGRRRLGDLLRGCVELSERGADARVDGRVEELVDGDERTVAALHARRHVGRDGDHVERLVVAAVAQEELLYVINKLNKCNQLKYNS